MKPVDGYQTYDACRKQMVGLFTFLQQLVYKNNKSLLNSFYD